MISYCKPYIFNIFSFMCKICKISDYLLTIHVYSVILFHEQGNRYFLSLMKSYNKRQKRKGPYHEVLSSFVILF